MDFSNFAILYLLSVFQVGGYFWLQKAARKETRHKSVYKYISESHLLVSFLISIAFELIGMAFQSP